MNPSDLSNASLFRQQGYIDGAWVHASDGATFSVENPATGENIGQVPNMPRSQVKAAVASAKAAFPAWSRLTAYERQAYLVSLSKLMTEHAEDLAIILTAENGKPLAEARGEIAYGKGFCDWFAAEAVRTYGTTIPAALPGVRNSVIKQPVGVCGLITPWYVAPQSRVPARRTEDGSLQELSQCEITRKLAPALAAGCTTVIKAPAETPYSALAMCVLAEKAGIPKGVINVVTVNKGERESDCGLELCENPLVKKISFTGSTPVGRLLMKQCSSTVKKLSFELGGNAPFIVFDDATLDTAITGVVASKFRGSGQTCVCANRIYVQSGIYDRFALALKQRVETFKVGNGMESGVNIGPLINERGVEKVARHVKDAVEKGAKVLTGGGSGQGCFYPPTVLTDVESSADISTEETFGPLAALFRFETESEVIDRANDSEVGLGAYVFTNNISRAIRVSEGLETGMVGINTGILSQPCVPFGGVKQSGFGREGGPTGIDDYQISKLLVSKIDAES